MQTGHTNKIQNSTVHHQKKTERRKRGGKIKIDINTVIHI